MITVKVKNCKSISQDYYDSIINTLQLNQLTCCCGHSGCMTIHAYYSRKVKLPNGLIISLRILRVKCSECGRTHAVLLSSMVPYSQISLLTHQIIVLAYEDRTDPFQSCTNTGSIDENNVKTIIRKYITHWRQRLLSERISLSSLDVLISSCFAFYSTQFMQIRSTYNILFKTPT